MNEAKQWIERYIQATLKKLPQKNRKDLEIEIRAYLADTMEEKQVNEQKVEEVKQFLQEMGEPTELAKQYQEKERYLIGPDHYDNYLWVLKIVTIATVVGMLIATCILPMLDASMSVMDTCIAFFSSTITSLVIAFAFVTVIFSIIEKGYGSKQESKKWKVEELPELAVQKAEIKKGSVIVGIIFTVFVIILFNYAPNFMGINIIENGKWVSYPFFQPEILVAVLPLFNIAMLLGIIRECIKAVVGKYTKSVSIIIVILNVIAWGLSIVAFSKPELMNPNMMQGINQLMQENQVEKIEFFEQFFTQFPRFFLGLISFAFCLDSVEAVYRAIRYDK